MRYYEATVEDFFPVEEEALSSLSHAKRRSEQSSGMVKLMLEFLMKDLIYLEPRSSGYQNIATPTLDLSQLQHKEKGEQYLLNRNILKWF